MADILNERRFNQRARQRRGVRLRSSRSDRGAAIVEYGLALALLSLVTMGSIDAFSRGATAAMEESVADVGTPVAAVPTSGGDDEGAPGGPDDGAAGSGSGSGAGSPSTTEATTTTVAPTTTTTAAPSTTAAPAPPTSEADSGQGSGGPEGAVSAGPASGRTYWWSGKSGQWVAELELANAWERHAYLTIEVTRVWGDGERDEHTVTGFYVPGGGSSRLDVWSNDLKDNGAEKDDVVAVEYRVVRVVTATLDWKPIAFEVDEPSGRAEAPPFPNTKGR